MIKCVYVALVVGLTTIGLSYATALLGPSVNQLALSIFGVVLGPLLATFMLGMFFPFVNTWVMTSFRHSCQSQKRNLFRNITWFTYLFDHSSLIHVQLVKTLISLFKLLVWLLIDWLIDWQYSRLQLHIIIPTESSDSVWVTLVTTW